VRSHQPAEPGFDLLRVDPAGKTLWHRYILQPDYKEPLFAPHGLWTFAVAVSKKGDIVVGGTANQTAYICEVPFLFWFDLDGKMVEGFEKDFL
jgi:hypothetical protein